MYVWATILLQTVYAHLHSSWHGELQKLSEVATRAHHRDEIPERDVTYHLTCLLIYH